ncbi:SRPBCC family protein [Ahrensia kielensis]|uniref:SRPBCC family protein n=1 Tax=Ahrensia kielensis TaxID=76980 RepID=UPI00035DCF84|nr:SRPBCC domain-containing protein [Ahrensia kielensis]
MNTKLQFDFLVDKQKNTLTIKKEFAASRQQVWDCYTKSELLDKWFAPKPLTTKTSFMNFKEGGYWHYVMIDPDGQEYWSRLDYETITPIENYTALDGFCDASGALNPDLPRSKWDVTFTEKSGNCLVQTIGYYNSTRALEQIIDMGMQDGMTSTLERLDELLVTLAQK